MGGARTGCKNVINWFAKYALSLRFLNVNLSLLIYLQLVQKYGPEAERHLLRCLFSCIDFNNEKIANRDSPQVSID